MKISLMFLMLFLLIGPSYAQDCSVVRDVVFMKFCDSISFIWDPNSETDLAGYRVYRSGTEGGFVNYSTDPNSTNFIEATAAPITTLTVTNVPPGLWYWRVTAFDEAGNESDFSNFVVSYHIGIAGQVTNITGTPN